MCKAARFADHAHKKWPCTKCDVPRGELYTDQSFANGMYSFQSHSILNCYVEYTPRNSKDFCRKLYVYNLLDSEDAHKRFLDEHGVCWTEFAQLSYFDVVRCSVIDPMHNLLQGVVKNQWFSRWIKNSALRPATDRRPCKLSAIHAFIDLVSCTIILSHQTNLFNLA
jgi:hypothetical protein